ncbi:pilus assembly FimT family protein [Amphritea pacifica]|uniref:Prepilin-type N-terminal cleavage/methylation domain-containing protein n=1 Tax=Amphritea pacifica TaxID=2811233 RepID=A0ABS2W768_9GAMM|nr:prepilin-type N-terminal cleavage/methylation domain-containing protein [Amphritea pacifica]MBN0987539.1 prepilin-type N-terminal cleavage/methylation domain-containing protein [Amphritea pacifica]
MQPYSVPQRGFTLLEMLVVMAIAGMLLALVVPRFGSAFAGAQFQQQVHDLNTALNQARNRASATGKIVRLQLSDSDRSLIDNTGVPVFNWPEDCELVFADAEHQPIDGGFILFIPGAGSNGAALQLIQQRDAQPRRTEFRINWLTGGVSYAAL